MRRGDSEPPACRRPRTPPPLKEEGARGDFGPCLVEGPISFDLAHRPGGGGDQGLPQPPWRGDADVFLVPSSSRWGNLMCKALYGMAGGKMAGVGAGGLRPHHRQLPQRRPGGEVRLHRHRRGDGPVQFVISLVVFYYKENRYVLPSLDSEPRLHQHQGRRL